MLSHRQHIKSRIGKKNTNQVSARLRNTQDRPRPDYQDAVNPRENYVYMYIEQHTAQGVKIDKINFYMDSGRSNSWNIKHNGYIQIHESGKKLFRAGTHRALAWIAKNIFPNMGRHDE